MAKSLDGAEPHGSSPDNWRDPVCWTATLYMMARHLRLPMSMVLVAHAYFSGNGSEFLLDALTIILG